MGFIHQNPPLYTAVRRDLTEHWKRAPIIGWYVSREGQVAEPVVFHPSHDTAMTFEEANGFDEHRYEHRGCYASELEANVAIRELNA